MFKCKAPILFLIFNRPDTTKRVFAEIRKARPKKIFVASDGPRENKEGEEKLVEKTRKIVLDMIDWDCEVKTLFREKNLGCKIAVSSAIDWFFDQIEDGIILEDDCLPSQSFFKFCEELLYKYKDDKRVMIISGFNKQGVWNSSEYDYFYSKFGGIWGWATWKSAWQHYDGKMKLLDLFIRRNYFQYELGKGLGKIRKVQMINAPETSWDFPWAFARHVNSGLACVPSKSLIENIGFGENATHTKHLVQKNSVIYDIDFPLKGNPLMVADMKYDKLFHPSISILAVISRRFYEIIKK